MRIVCISDTHSYHHKTVVPDGDILLHAGDITRMGKREDVESFDRWLGVQPHKYKIVICGNHDFCFQEEPEKARRCITNAIYLEDSGVEIKGLRIYGSPWQPYFGGWAFNLERGPALAAKWAMIPDDTQILITHGPPEGILDMTSRGQIVGDRDLLDRVRTVKPWLHVFGHIHESAGRMDIDGTTFVNASTQLGVGTGIVVEWNDSPTIPT